MSGVIRTDVRIDHSLDLVVILLQGGRRLSSKKLFNLLPDICETSAELAFRLVCDKRFKKVNRDYALKEDYDRYILLYDENDKLIIHELI